MTQNLLFFDSETTGFPSGKVSLDHEKQPHLVQIGALLVQPKTREVLATLNVMVKPNGWFIPTYTTDVHGITTEHAEAKGIPEEEALRLFLSIQNGAVRIAHNFDFDNKIINVGLSRFGCCGDWGRSGDSFCTLKAVRGRYPSSSLPKLYKHLFNEEFDAHDALEDAKACMRVYFHHVDNNIFALNIK